eukprot:gnl/TRDRNA2_/TRDRNA2_172001_c10_seq1.p1 gnl/TRDRNA2_/TRDRNA2_172001_c10~~gnl/TRDRNA2_/TRDRNA2_172001_c10_seq1.p1  ORF type:complete len:178 (+),score=43.22 gnl/TRDRNA2_/TRDRNA2_172001_c10_seq1:31-564(+)
MRSSNGRMPLLCAFCAALFATMVAGKGKGKGKAKGSPKARETMQEMAKAIAHAEVKNSFDAGEMEIPPGLAGEKGVRNDLMLACIHDKESSMREQEGSFQQKNQLLLDLASCCVPIVSKDQRPSLNPKCVEFMAPAYEVIRDAKRWSDYKKAFKHFNQYRDFQREIREKQDGQHEEL